MGRLLSHKQDFITVGDLYDRGWKTGFAMLNVDRPRNAKVIRGASINIELSKGLSVHYSDTCELDSISIETASDAHVAVRLFLEGDVEACIGNTPIPTSYQTEPEGLWKPIASIFSQVHKERFYRKMRKGQRVRKVIITMTHDWLRDHDLGGKQEEDLIRQFTSCHLACKSWQPSPAALAWAEQIINPPENPLFLQRLYMESRVLNLIAEAFGQILSRDREQTQNVLRPQDRQRIERLEAYLEEHATQSIKALDIASHTGVSVNTLQRLCQLAYGTSVSDYVRSWRMDKARHALEFDNASIAEAAFLAGYGSPANFSTAFKRHFGMSPSEVAKGLG